MAITAFQKLKSKFDWPLFGAIIGIIVIGMVNLYSATRVAPKGLYQNQIMWFTVGAVIFVITAASDYRLFERLAYAIYCVSIVLLVAVLVGGKTVKGSSRWLGFGSFWIQPSELAKIAVAVLIERGGFGAKAATPVAMEIYQGYFDLLKKQQAAEAQNAGRRVDRAGEAGRVLASLAVSRKLRDAVATAVGFPVAPTYRAVYLYDLPRSHVRTHVDTHDYEVVFHLILEHAVPQDGKGSALVVHRPGEASARRVRLKPGEAVALRGRGMIHSWEPVGAQEHRTLLAIGFQPAAAA